MVNAFALGQIKVHTLVKTVGPVGLMKCEFQRLTQAVNLFTLFSSRPPEAGLFQFLDG
jgi:hypothetical protein